MESVLRFLSEEGEDDHEEEELSAADKSTVRTVKIIVLFVLLFAGCFVFFPFTRYVNNTKKDGCCKGSFFAILTSFAAGMLLSLSFIHILPEASMIYK